MGLADGMAFENEFGKDIWKKKPPKYLVRPNDYCVFSLNDDGETYDIDNKFIDFPGHSNFKLDLLLTCGFFEIEESEFDIYYKKFEAHYERESKRWKNDGHGGIKEDIRYRPENYKE